MKEVILYKFIPSVIACAVAVGVVLPMYDKFVKPHFAKKEEGANETATSEDAE